MAIEFQGTIEGLSGLEANIAELIRDYGPRNGANTLRIPVRRALEPVAETIRANTPVDSGQLQQSVKTVVSTPNRRDQGPHVDPNNTIIVGRTGWTWRTPSLWNRALAIEFGNATVPANPVLVPALMRNTTAMTTIFSSELRSNIDRTARRLENRQRAGTLNRR